MFCGIQTFLIPANLHIPLEAHSYPEAQTNIFSLRKLCFGLTDSFVLLKCVAKMAKKHLRIPEAKWYVYRDVEAPNSF